MRTGKDLFEYIGDIVQYKIELKTRGITWDNADDFVYERLLEKVVLTVEDCLPQNTFTLK